MNLRRSLIALALSGAVLSGTATVGAGTPAAAPVLPPASVSGPVATAAHDAHDAHDAPATSGEHQEHGTTAGLSITSTLRAPFALLSGLGGTSPRWNPCETVQWRFNPAGAPVGGFGVVGNALKRISAVSGLRFQYMGTSTATPSSAYLEQSYGAYKPLLIGWTTSARSDLLRNVDRRTVGVTRVKWVGWSLLTGDVSQLATGTVAFNAASKAPLYGPNSRYTYALHELGHAVGLSHVSSSYNLMNAVIPTAMRDLGAGDGAGLRRVGATAGCLHDLRAG